MAKLPLLLQELKMFTKAFLEDTEVAVRVIVHFTQLFAKESIDCFSFKIV